MERITVRKTKTTNWEVLAISLGLMLLLFATLMISAMR